jgi:hypothetical protein
VKCFGVGLSGAFKTVPLFQGARLSLRGLRGAWSACSIVSTEGALSPIRRAADYRRVELPGHRSSFLLHPLVASSNQSSRERPHDVHLLAAQSQKHVDPTARYGNPRTAEHQKEAIIGSNAAKLLGLKRKK